MEVNALSLEALRRNGHNLQLGEFECEGQYDTPKLQPIHLAEKLDWTGSVSTVPALRAEGKIAAFIFS